MALTIDAFDAALKEIYRESNYSNTTMKKRPLMALLPKFTMFGGKRMPLPNMFSDPQNQSADFATAIGTAANVNGTDRVGIEAFELTRVSNYGICKIGTEVAEASETDEMAFLQGLKAAIDGTINSLSNRLETQLFRSGSGRIGVVASPGGYVAGAATFTLQDIGDVANFEVGMALEASPATATAGGPPVVTEPTDGATLIVAAVLVTGVDRTTGVITAGAAWDAAIPGGFGAFAAPGVIPGLATGFSVDASLYPKGDGRNGNALGVGTDKCIAGLRSWLCTAAEAAAGDFFGVDRSVDSRLYGQSLAGGGAAIEDLLIDAASLSERVGGTPNLALLHHVRMRELIKNLHNSQQYDTVNAVTHKGVVADIGFRSVNVQTGDGKIDVVSAARCPEDTIFMLQTDTWLLATLGQDIVELQDLDGKKVLRVHDQDEVAARFRFRGNLGCKAPIYNVRVDL